MISRKFDVHKKDIKSLRFKTFRMFLTGILILNVLFVISSFQSNDLIFFKVFHILYGMITLSVLIFCNEKVFLRVAVAFMSMTQFIVLPVLFFSEGGLLGPAPVWMAFHTIFLFLFLGKKGTMLFFLGTVCEYSYLFSRVYHWPELVRFPEKVGRMCASSLFAIVTAGGWLIMFILVQQSFSDREKKYIRENSERIHKAGTRKNYFLNDLAVEIRQPITSIMGMCELILKEEKDHLIHGEMEKIRSSCYDFLSLVDDTISYSRLGLSSSAAMDACYRFDELIDDVVEAVSSEMNEKKLRFIVIAHADIPKRLFGNAKRIRQVFQQVILASLQMTSEGRIQLEIWSNKDKESNTVLINCRISDTGRGMKQEEADTLFGHYTIHKGKEGSGLEGIGMKLNVCREYLATMDGTIKVRSLENIGMAVEFKFRNQLVNDEQIASVTVKSDRRILIYEGDMIDRQGWLGMMKELKLEAEYVHNRYHFECAVRDRKFDFIFITRPVYESLQAIIAYYHCEAETYVIADDTSVYGDFGKCRLLRSPLYSVKIAEIIEGGWNEEDYRYSGRQGNFIIKNVRILVIDSHAVDLKVANGIFSNYGVNIDIAVSGKEGLKKVKKEKYNLILTDLMISEMNGYELLKEIRMLEDSPNRDTPVVAISSAAGENIKEVALAEGFQFFIGKPFRIKDIEECLIHCIPQEMIYKKEKEINPETRKDEFDKKKHGLDLAVGLSNIGNNEESYLAILGTYYTENMRKQENLSDIFKKEDLLSFISAVHSIKSASAGIGALRLSALARELEFAGKDGEVGVISERLPLFIKEYQLILDEIKEYLEKHDKLPKAEEERFYNSSEQSLDRSLLLKLKAELDKMDLKSSAKTLEQLTAVNYGEHHNGEIRKLKQACERFDFHIAKIILNNLINDQI